MTEGTRLFDPPTARDCVWGADKIGRIKAMLVTAIDENPAFEPAFMVAISDLNLLGELLAAIAGDADVSLGDGGRDGE